MRLLHVASSYPLTSEDSTAPFMAEMLEALAWSGHDVTVLVPRTTGLAEGNRGGVRVIGVPYAPTPFQVWGYGRSLGQRDRLRLAAAAVTPVALGAMARAVRMLIRRESPDLVHLHWVLPLGALASLLPRDTPVVLSAHGADARFATGRLRPLAQAALARADAVVAASSQILQVLATVHPGVADKAHVIPHGANAALFHPRDREEARSRLDVPSHVHVALGVGRLVPKKGFDILIEGFRHLATPDARLYLVGDGPDRRRLEAMVPEAVANRIIFVGACDRGQVADWYAASDVVVIAGQPAGSDFDSGPVVLVEALAAGRPVVTARTGMAPDVVRSGENGILLDSRDPKALAEAIDRVIAESDRMGREARLTFEKLGDWDRVAGQLQAIYQRVTGRPQ